MYDVAPLSDGLIKLTFGRDVQSKPWLSEGALLWRTSDAVVDSKLKKLASSATVKRTAVDVAVSVRDGLLTVKLTDSKHTVVEEVVVEPPATQPLTSATIVKAVGSLGDTPWKLGSVDVEIEGDWWCYAGDIKTARRKAVEGRMGGFYTEVWVKAALTEAEREAKSKVYVGECQSASARWCT